MPPNLEDVSKSLIPRELCSHASLASLHFYCVSDHILSYPLFHTTGNRKLCPLLYILCLISESPLILSSPTITPSHQSLTLPDSLFSVSPENIHFFTVPLSYLSLSYLQVLFYHHNTLKHFPDSSLIPGLPLLAHLFLAL